ncbi:DUF488 family protein, N3 subclade [Ferroglobus placidus]|nr:DUF488 family protein [Ferroglobus placidus]
MGGVRKRYREELERNKESLEKLIEIIKEQKRTTLLYSARGTKCNSAVVLLEIVKEMLAPQISNFIQQ